MTEYDTLILSGGSIKAICELGALQYGYDEKLLDKVHTVVGASAGSALGYLCIIGYTPIELMVTLCSNPLFKDNLPFVNVMQLLDMNGEGAISFSPFQELLEQLTIAKVGKLLTLESLYNKFNKRLVVSSYNYPHDIEYFTPESHPDLGCIMAIRMSCAIPFIFKMCTYMGSKYMDAALYENFPVGYLKQDDTCQNVLGILIEPFFYEDTDNSNIYHFLHNLLSIPMKTLSEHQLESILPTVNNIDVIRINTDVHLLQYCLNSKEKLDLFSNGYSCAQTTFHPMEEVDDVVEEVEIPGDDEVTESD